MTRFVVALFLASSIAFADEIADLAARIENLAAKEPLPARADTFEQAAKVLEPFRPELASHFQALTTCIITGAAPKAFALPKLTPENTVLQRVVENVEKSGDNPAAYNALARVIRANQLSAGLDNPSIRARIALADLGDLLDPPLIALDGTEVRLSRYRSKPVLLAFWATWCVPCRAELSKLEKVAAASPGLAVLAVSREPRETVTDFLRRHPYNLPFFIDAGHRLSDRFHIDELPATVKLDPLKH